MDIGMTDKNRTPALDESGRFVIGRTVSFIWKRHGTGTL